MQAIPMALMVAGKLVKGVGGLQAGNAQKKALDRQAREEENAAALQTLRIREQARSAIGDQLGGQWSNGFVGGTGSALDSILESQTNMLLDTLTVQREAATKGASLRAEGKQARTQGRMALVGSLLDIGSTVAGGADDWAQAKRGTSAAKPASS